MSAEPSRPIQRRTRSTIFLRHDAQLPELIGHLFHLTLLEHHGLSLQHGDKAAEVWKGLADNIVTVTPGWSEAYGLFLEGEADMVLSYTTSPAYHLLAESDDSKAAALFDEGHYMQIEVAGKLAATDQPELADKFLDFMLTDAFQSVIPQTNWMYPAVTPAAGLPEGFDTCLRGVASKWKMPSQKASMTFQASVKLTPT